MRLGVVEGVIGWSQMGPSHANRRATRERETEQARGLHQTGHKVEDGARGLQGPLHRRLLMHRDAGHKACDARTLLSVSVEASLTVRGYNTVVEYLGKADGRPCLCAEHLGGASDGSSKGGHACMQRPCHAMSRGDKRPAWLAGGRLGWAGMPGW